MKRTTRLAAGLVLVVELVAGAVGAAFAAEPAKPGAASAAAVARVGGLDGGGGVPSTPSPAVAVARDPALGVFLSTPEGTVNIGVPGATRAGDGTAFGSTAVYAGAAAGTDVAVQPHGTDGVRLMTVLDSPEAPHRFAYPMTAPDGATLRLTDDGGALLFLPATPGSASQVVATIAPAWAVDANGAPVATHYEVQGMTLTQVVAHRASTAYPVVADPSLQGDCGIVTCTIRLDRAWTRNARDASWIISSTSVICAAISGPGAVVCAAAVAIPAVALAVYAGRVYEDGDCLGIRFLKFPPPGGPPPAWPVRVRHGTYNCR